MKSNSNRLLSKAPIILTDNPLSSSLFVEVYPTPTNFKEMSGPRLLDLVVSMSRLLSIVFSTGKLSS